MNRIQSTYVVLDDAGEISAEAKPEQRFRFGDGVHPRKIIVACGPLTVSLSLNAAEALIDAVRDALDEARALPQLEP